ncbi:MAG: hypothetical protein GY842_21885 [bacterium]|nr:hypothetical protein [bacterium]
MTLSSNRAIVGWVAFVLLAATSGCGGGADFGESIVVPAERHARFGDGIRQGKALVLPAEMSFNVTDAQRYSQGDASAEASVEDSGKARCSASAQADGMSWAEFQLGHVFTSGEQALDATVTFDVTYRYNLSVSEDAGLSPADMFALKVYIRDSRRRVLKRMMLADWEPAKGPTAWSGTQSPSFDVTFEPDVAYHLVLAGRVKVGGDADRSTGAEIGVDSLKLTVAPR